MASKKNTTEPKTEGLPAQQENEQSRLSKLRASHKRLEQEILDSGLKLMSPEEMRQLHTGKVYAQIIPKKKDEKD